LRSAEDMRFWRAAAFEFFGEVGAAFFKVIGGFLPSGGEVFQYLREAGAALF